jgi:DNA mismatch endonuclease Vsr
VRTGILSSIVKNPKDNLTRDQRSKNMRAIKSENTQIEILLRRELSSRGHRFRIHYKTVLGKPDIAFPGPKIVIFCDSEFFHGYRWRSNRKRIHSNRGYWIPKIERNMKRDAEVNRQLRKAGWVVLRFWGHEIKKNLDRCVRKIEETLSARS